MKRPLPDRLELVSPALTRMLTRAVVAAPSPLRRAVLSDAFARAQDAFNRGDLEVVFAAFSADVDYDPPPPLPGARHLTGRDEVFSYWRRIFDRFDDNRIENLDVIEVGRGTVRRTARLRHADSRTKELLEYEILQTTEIRGGAVVRQVNELLPDRG
jgi:hypothetical protein